jgi:hypothetical protein
MLSRGGFGTKAFRRESRGKPLEENATVKTRNRPVEDFSILYVKKDG